MRYKEILYLVLGTANILLLVIVTRYLALNENASVNSLIFIIMVAIAVFLEMFTTYKILQIYESKLHAPLNTLIKHLEKYYQTAKFELPEQDFPKEFKELNDLIHRTINGLENLKNELHVLSEEKEKSITELERELNIQKEATLKVLQEIEEEKEVSQARAQELQKFQLAVEEASDHIVITDENGLVLYTNSSGERITGYTKDEMIGTKAGTLWGGIMHKNFYEEMWNTIKNNKEVFKSEITNKRKDESTYIAEISISPIVDENLKVIFFVSIQRDITKAKEVDRMKTEFISLASHQLRAPLAAVRWNLETILDELAGPLNASQKQYTEDAYESTTRMVDLVNGLLNVSRIESGRLIIDPQLTNLEDIVQGVLKEVQIGANERNHVITLAISNDVPLLNIDPKLVRNVYLNLLTNAIKYTPANGQIDINIYTRDRNVISEIKDNGYGIPKSLQSHIFEKFYRADNIRQFDTNGTGLGLYLVKAIVEASNGEVWFTSEENKGTAFYFSLPLEGMHAREGEVTLENQTFYY